MKSLVVILLYILIVCPACTSQGSPSVTPSSTATTITTTSTSPIPAPTHTQLPPSQSPISWIVIDNVAISQQGQLYASGFGKGSDFRHFTRWDGTRWIELGNGFLTAGNTLVVDNAGYLYTDILVDSEQGQATAIMRWDGLKWEDITGNFIPTVDALKAGRISSNIPVMTLAVDGKDNLYAAGIYYYPTADRTKELPMGYIAQWNRQTWTVLGQGLDMINIFGMAVNSIGKVYVSGEQPPTPENNASYLAQWDGETWNQLTTSGQNTIQSIALDKAGRLYIYYQSNVIASWDSTDWITITDQLSGAAPAVYDMTVDENGRLYIGGSFEAVSGIPARNIAYWDGGSWHALGGGTNDRVNGLASGPEGYIYAVGFFTEAGGAPADHAARWDGETWHTLGP